MSKFKVGDRVRCIDDDGTSLVAGETYAVDRANEGWINVTVKGFSVGYFSSRFEPLAPTTPVREVTPTPWHIERESEEYTIRGANREWIANNTNYYPSAPSEDDAEFIVTAVNAYEANQAEIERLRSLVSECLKQLDMIIERGEPTDFIQWRAELAAALEPKP